MSLALANEFLIALLRGIYCEHCRYAVQLWSSAYWVSLEKEQKLYKPLWCLFLLLCANAFAGNPNGQVIGKSPYYSRAALIADIEADLTVVLIANPDGSIASVKAVEGDNAKWFINDLTAAAKSWHVEWITPVTEPTVVTRSVEFCTDGSHENNKRPLICEVKELLGSNGSKMYVNALKTQMNEPAAISGWLDSIATPCREKTSTTSLLDIARTINCLWERFAGADAHAADALATLDRDVLKETSRAPLWSAALNPGTDLSTENQFRALQLRGFAVMRVNAHRRTKTSASIAERWRSEYYAKGNSEDASTLHRAEVVSRANTYINEHEGSRDSGVVGYLLATEFDKGMDDDHKLLLLESALHNAELPAEFAELAVNTLVRIDESRADWPSALACMSFYISHYGK